MADEYLEHLRALPFVLSANIAIPSTGMVDGHIRIKTPTGSVTLPYEEKRSHLSEALIRLIANKSALERDLLVLAPEVGRGAAKALEEAGLNYIDLDGNCFLRIGKQYLAKVQGQHRTQTQAVDRALRAPALKVLFALIVEPELINATTRVIAARAGDVSPQTASDVRRRLSEQGAALQSKAGWHWADAGRRDAIDTFVAAHSATLFPSLLIGRFRAQKAETKELETSIAAALKGQTEWRFSGAAACQRLTGYYRGDQTLVYLQEMPVALARKLRLVPDSNGPIAFARSPGLSALASPDDSTVHPLLVYADLLRENNDRAREAAKEVYERFVQPMVTA